MTISIGLVTVGGGEQLPWEAVLHQADEALYRAKANGRNRTRLAEPPLLGLTRDLADDMTFLSHNPTLPASPPSAPDDAPDPEPPSSI